LPIPSREPDAALTQVLRLPLVGFLDRQRAGRPPAPVEKFSLSIHLDLATPLTMIAEFAIELTQPPPRCSTLPLIEFRVQAAVARAGVRQGTGHMMVRPRTERERDIVCDAPELLDDRIDGGVGRAHLFREVLRDRIEVACVRHGQSSYPISDKCIDLD
jgi:hypothetical protein